MAGFHGEAAKLPKGYRGVKLVEGAFIEVVTGDQKRADANARDLATDPVELHSALSSSGTSPNWTGRMQRGMRYVPCLFVAR
jgi:hypothetical protein